MLADVAELAASSIPEVTDALDAEQWASSLIGTWRHQSLPGEDADAIFFPGVGRCARTFGTAPALAALRALSAVGAPDRATRARAAADRLAAAGLPEPAWADGLEDRHGRPRRR